jgi:hypothetical protein
MFRRIGSNSLSSRPARPVARIVYHSTSILLEYTL